MRSTILIILIVAAIIISMLAYYSLSSPFLISSAEAKARLSQGQFDVVLDVRTNMEYNLGHYPGAAHVPVAEIAASVPRMFPDKQTKILVYCNTGQRSRYAAELLQGLGYKNTRYIAGSYMTLRR